MESLKILSELDVAAVTLVAGLLWIMLVLRAARIGGFSWAGALKDDAGKESALRFAVLVALVISSWLLMYVSLNVIKNGDDMQALFPFFATYLAVWSGAKVVEKLLDLLLAKYAK